MEVRIEKTSETVYNLPMELIHIDDRISYIPATENPLSADVGIVEGDDAVWFFDVGSEDSVATFIENYDTGFNSKSERKKKFAVISHFHTDHTANLPRIHFDKIFLGKYTLKYLKIIQNSSELQAEYGSDTPTIQTNADFSFEDVCQIITEPIEVDDGIKLRIAEIPSSHTKGAVYLQAEKYTFLGDATFYGYKREKKFYNVQLLQQEIAALKEIDSAFFLLSHRRHFTKQKKAVVTLLEQIYNVRKPNATEIEIF